MRTARVVIVLLLALTTACTRSRRANRGTVRDEKPKPSQITQAPLKIVFFDLGQADAMLVLFDGKTLLMDAGESRESSDTDKFHSIAKTLEQLTGSKHLDYFVLSHYHRDHVGDPSGTGPWGVINDGVTIDTIFDRGEIIYGDDSKGGTQKDFERGVTGWLSTGKAKAHRPVNVGDSVDLGEGLKVVVVAVNGNGNFEQLVKDKPEELSAFPASENDYSVALKLTYGDFELFAGGDLTGETSHRNFKGSREGYHDVESSTAARVGDVEIYRVNHHGSAHSSNPCFVKVLHPEVSIISSGANNYGHPSARAYDPLMDMGKVFITGGADDKVKDHVYRSIVGGDITVNVETGGKRFSVNGRDFNSKTEEQEAALPDHMDSCPPRPW